MQARKVFFVGFMAALTASATWACYWQTTKYFRSQQRWTIIAKELNSSKPTSLSLLGSPDFGEVYAFKYVQVEGELSEKHIQVTRSKDGRMGYLVLRSLKYQSQNSTQPSEIMALEGWCPQQHECKSICKTGSTSYQGILRVKEKVDYLHENMSKEDLERYQMNTYINLQESIGKLGLTVDSINTSYYLEILKPLHYTEGEYFPYQYSVDNFQLPYLTPDKHRAYATFWGSCTLIGLAAIAKAMRMK